MSRGQVRVSSDSWQKKRNVRKGQADLENAFRPREGVITGSLRGWKRTGGRRTLPPPAPARPSQVCVEPCGAGVVKGVKKCGNREKKSTPNMAMRVGNTTRQKVGHGHWPGKRGGGNTMGVNCRIQWGGGKRAENDQGTKKGLRQRGEGRFAGNFDFRSGPPQKSTNAGNPYLGGAIN